MKAPSINAWLFLASVLIFAIVVSFDINFFDYKVPMSYAEWKQITWSDFRGIKRPLQTLDGTSEFAFISTEIRISETTTNSFEVTTYFHPCRSYVYNRNVMQKGLFKHELYHLHITEYIARQIRQKLTGLTPSSNDIDVMETELRQKESDLQQSYDGETEHGFRLAVQKRWESRIDSSLNAMINFSNPIVQ